MDRVNENEDEKEYVSTSQRRSRRRGVMQKLLSLLLGEDLALNRNLGIFIVITLADFLAFTAIYIPYTHLPPLAKFVGISSRNAAFLISAGGISNTVGRCLGGWLSDISWINPI